MENTLFLTSEQAEIIKKHYSSFIDERELAYVQWRIKVKETVITLYTSNKLVFQGKNWTLFYEEITSLLNIIPEVKSNFSDDLEDNMSTIGSDEVGIGDYFGPIIVCSCFVSKEKHVYLRSLNIKDSKKLSDSQINFLAPLIMNNTKYSVVSLNNETYNEITNNQSINLNKIKAILHNRALLNITKMKPPYEKIIIDAFTTKEHYFKYLESEKEVFLDINFVQKAEDKFLAVACSAIIARFHLINHFKEMSKNYNIVFPKGAGSPVDKVLEKILINRPEILPKIAKINFANTKKCKEKISLR